MGALQTAIPCDCPARHAPEGTDAHEEHDFECSYRPLCPHAECSNLGKPQVLVEDDIEAMIYGGYRCPSERGA